MKEFDYSIDKSVFLSKANFADYIEHMLLESPGLTYFEAILKFSEESDKEPSMLIPFMSEVLLEKVKRSAVENDLIRSDVSTIEDFL
jgi:hypothetical protein